MVLILMLKFLLAIFLIGFVSGVEIDFDCPDEIYAGEEFECDIEVDDGDGKYDLKIEVDKKRDSVLKIWDGETWDSGYYYVNDFIQKNEVVRLKIAEEGRYDVVVKLRDGEWKEEFDAGKLKVLAVEDNGGIIEENTNSQAVQISTDFDEKEKVIDLDRKIVSLDGKAVIEDEWDYVSKDALFVDWLPYLLCLFLICLVGIMAWDKF